MKKNILVLLLNAIIVIFAGCSRNNKSENPPVVETLGTGTTHHLKMEG